MRCADADMSSPAASAPRLAHIRQQVRIPECLTCFELFGPPEDARVWQSDVALAGCTKSNRCSTAERAYQPYCSCETSSESNELCMHSRVPTSQANIIVNIAFNGTSELTERKLPCMRPSTRPTASATYDLAEQCNKTIARPTLAR